MSQGRGVGAAVTKGCTFVSINILRRVPLRRSSQPCTFAIENDYYCATDKLLLSLGADRRCLQGGGCLVAVNTLFVTAYVLLCVEQKTAFGTYHCLVVASMLSLVLLSSRVAQAR